MLGSMSGHKAGVSVCLIFNDDDFLLNSGPVRGGVCDPLYHLKGQLSILYLRICFS